MSTPSSPRKTKSGNQTSPTATVIQFPTIRMVGLIRQTAARIAAAPADQQQAMFAEAVRSMRSSILALNALRIGNHKPAHDFAWALADELVRLGVRGGFEGWLKNWHPSVPPARSRGAR